MDTGALCSKSALDRGLRMDTRGIEQGNGTILRLYQKHDFGTAQDHRFGASPLPREGHGCKKSRGAAADKDCAFHLLRSMIFNAFAR